MEVGDARHGLAECDFVDDGPGLGEHSVLLKDAE